MPSELETLRAWFSYLGEARRGYLATFAKLPPAELHRARGASFASMLDIFEHSQGAFIFWISKCAAAPLPSPPRETGTDPPPAEVLENEIWLQDQVRRFLAALRAEELDRRLPIPRGSTLDHACELPVRDILWHLVEEELQHRGELNALLWQIEVDAPVYDWITWRHASGNLHGPPPG